MPARGVIYSQALLAIDKANVWETLQNKRRVLVPVQIFLYDSDAVLVMQAMFEWFVLVNAE